MEDKDFGKPMENIVEMVEKVLRGLKSLNAGKSMRPGVLNPLLLKTMSRVFCVTSYSNFRESVNSGKRPEEWKDARVTPLFYKRTKI